MKYVFFIFIVTFTFHVFSQELKVDSIEFKSDYIICQKDTFNRFNSFGNKEGKWLKYKNNRWLLILNSHSRESSIILDSIKLEKKYYDGIFVYQICEYQNGLKEGNCIEYYENYQIKYVANFEKNELIYLVFYNMDADTVATIKKLNNGNYILSQKNTTFEYSKKEIYSVFEFE